MLAEREGKYRFLVLSRSVDLVDQQIDIISGSLREGFV